METKVCKNCEQNFSLNDEDFEFLKKFEVPAPSHCPDCRSQRRYSFRCDRNFYRRNCDMCKKPIVSIISTDKPLKVFCNDCYMSDKYDPLEYGADFDFSRSFFEQFAEMRARVPRISIYNTQNENSDFTGHGSRNKNCYITTSLVDCEDVYYSDWAMNCRDSSDLYLCQRMEKCYFCTDCEDCYQSAYLENCTNVNFSYLSFDCKSCNNLIGCVGLRRKEYMILNASVSKEEFENTLVKLKNDSAFNETFRKKYLELRLEIPVKSFWEVNTENCSGNYIVNSKNAKNSYNVKDIEDACFAYEAVGLKDAMDATRCAGGEFLYEVKAMIDLKFSKFCNLCYQSSNLEYCDSCQSSHDCFGCMGLKSNRYCILNKQYSKEEYEGLKARIIEQMKKTREYGEFFPMTLSIYGYNETKAQEFYPLTKEEASAKSLKWKDVDPKQYLPQTYKIPENIKDVPDSICSEILACETCSKNYKIISQELKFYREGGYPVPKKCQDCRHKYRMALQNPRKLWDRSCMKCNMPVKTTYSPDRKEKVYCEGCYLNEVQ